MSTFGPEPSITAAMCAAGRSLADPRVTRDGSQVAFVAADRVGARLVMMDAGGGSERVISTEPVPASRGGGLDWLPDGSALVYAATDGALWLQPSAGGPPRRLAAHTDGPVSAPAVSSAGDRVAYLVDIHHVAVASIRPGGAWPVRLSAGAEFCFDPAWSPDGTMVAWHEWDVPAMPWDSSRIVVAPGHGGGEARSVAGGEGVAVAQPRFGPDGSLGYLCDAHGWMNLWVGDPSLARHRPVLEEPAEHGGPSWSPGQRSFAWAPDGRSLALARNRGGFGSLDLIQVAGAVATATPEPVALAGDVHAGLHWRGPSLAAVRSGPSTPTRVVIRHGDGLATERTLAVGPVAGFGEADVRQPEQVSWPGEDGASIPGRLHRPPTLALGDPPPLMARVHGGPTGQSEARFRPELAYWLDRGWAVLEPDHRGSTGHGRAFTQALAGCWGELDVDDVAAGLRAAGERGWGHPRRLVVHGASAGGFTALGVLAQHPDLCAAGVDLYGVADLFEQAETTDRFEAHYTRILAGELPHAAERYRERSPVNLVEDMTAPLLVLHGGDDRVVSPAQSRAVADRLRALGREVELHVYEGEGHGWRRAETVVDSLERIDAFLRRHVLSRR